MSTVVPPDAFLLDDGDRWPQSPNEATRELQKLELAGPFESMKESALFNEADIAQFVESKLARQTRENHPKYISFQTDSQATLHQPLADNQEIRVLEVHPGEKTGMIA